MSEISDITLRIRVDIVNSAAILALVSNMNRVQVASQQMQDQTRRTSGTLTGTFARALGSAGAHLASVERKLDAVFRAGVHMQSMGRDLLGFAKSVGGAAKSLVDNWSEFQFTLNRAAAAADIFDTQSKLYDDLRAAVNSAAHELRVFPAEEVAKGLYFWQSTTGQTIKTQEDLQKTMKNVTEIMKVAAMTDTSYEQAIKGVYSTLKQFNLGMDQTVNVSALLFYATQKTALEFPDLINSLKMTGTVAGLAHEPLTSMIAVLGAVGNAGIRGSQAGRALRQTYIKLVKPTAAAKEVLDKLFKSQGGYNKVAFDSKGNFIGLEKYVMKLAASMKGLNYQQRANILATITTANELPVMSQMVAAADRAIKEHKSTWVDFLVTQEAANASFQGSWENLTGSWKGVVGGLQNAVQPVLQEVGKTIADMLTPALNDLNVIIWDNVPAFQTLGREIVLSMKPYVDWVSQAIHGLIQWAVQNPKIVKQFAKWAGIAAIVAAVAGAILLAVGTLTFMLANIVLITVGMVPLMAVFALLGGVIFVFANKVSQHFDRVKRVFGDFFSAFKRVFDLFIWGTDGAAKGTQSLMDQIDRFASGVLDGLLNFLSRFTEYLKSLTPSDVETIKTVIKVLLGLVILNKGLGLFADILLSITVGFRGLALGIKGMGGIVLGAAAIIRTLWGALSGTFGILRAVVVAILSFLATLSAPVLIVIALIAALVTAYATNFMGFRDFINGIVSWLVQVLPAAVQTALGAIGGLVNGIISPITEKLPTIIKFLQGIISSIATTWVPVLQGIADTAVSVFGSVAAAVSEVAAQVMEHIGPLVTELGRLGSVIYDFIGPAWNFLVTVIGGTVGLIIKIIVSFVNAIAPYVRGFTDLFLRAFGIVSEFIIRTVGNFVSVVIDVIRGFVQIVSGVIELFTSLLTGNWDKFWKGLSSIVSGFHNIIIGAVRGLVQLIGDIIRVGLQVVTGIFEFIFGAKPGSILATIGEFVGKAAKAIGDFAGSIVGFFAGIPGQVADVGKNIVYGLWDGIKGMMNWMIDKITGFIKNVIPGPIKDFLGISSPSKFMMGLGVSIVEGLAIGITKTDDALVAMNSLSRDIATVAMNASTSIGFGQTSLSVEKRTDSTRKIELSVDVSSSDGSVNNMDLGTLASLITGSDMTRALERMATVN